MDRGQRGGRTRPKPPSRGGPGYKVWHFAVPEALDAEVKRLAAEQRRTITQQVVWLVEQSVRREREQQRRARDGAAGAA